MEGFLVGLLIICFGLLCGFTIIFFITAITKFLDGDVIGVAYLIVGLVMCFLAVIVFKSIREYKTDWHEIEVKQVQIDTTYTTTKNKVDTTYVVRYIK